MLSDYYIACSFSSGLPRSFLHIITYLYETKVEVKLDLALSVWMCVEITSKKECKSAYTNIHFFWKRREVDKETPGNSALILFGITEQFYQDL